MLNRRALSLVLAGSTLLTLAACGGGDSDGGTGEFTTGIFKDSNVSGVSYRAGSIESITGDGVFNYEVGTNVRFWIGNVDLGSTLAKSVVTPVDLVAGGSTSSTAVLNIARFLMMLDTDNDPSGRIDISFPVSEAALNWPAVDFASPSFDTDVASIVTEASTVDPIPHTLPTANAAKSHLESTLRCVRAGAFRGSYGGDDTGPFGVLVAADTGELSGYAWSNEDEELLTLSGQSAVSFDQNGTFLSGDTNSGSMFAGSFTNPDRIAGTWENPDFATSGTFSGNRIGGVQSARYRFTGAFSGSAFGIFVFDIDGLGSVQGIAHTVYASADGTTDESASFGGTLTGTALSAQILDGGVVDATITGTMDTATGTTSGTWSDMDGNSGTFSGTGCQFN